MLVITEVLMAVKNAAFKAFPLAVVDQRFRSNYYFHVRRRAIYLA
jgi:hypothetical protein